MEPNSFRHIKLSGPNEKFDFTSTSSGGSQPKVPTRNREQHGNKIFQQLERVWDVSKNEYLVAYPERTGIYLEFISSPGFELMIKSLENLRKGIRLCNVRTEKIDENTERTLATVFIPNNKRDFFFKKVEKYLSESANTNLINSIEELNKEHHSTLMSFLILSCLN